MAGDLALVAAVPSAAAGRAVSGRPPHARGDRQKSFLVTLIAVVVLAAFLSPMIRSVSYALKSTDQITQDGSPLYPADPVTFSYQGKDLPILLVPIDGVTRQLALFEPARKKSTFIDPANPAAGADRSGWAHGGRSTTSGRPRRTSRTSRRSGT